MFGITTKFNFSTFLFLASFVHSKMTLHEKKSNQNYDIFVANGMPINWDEHPKTVSHTILLSENEIPIIRIDKPYESFNPCDESTFTTEHILPKLENFNVSTGVNYQIAGGWIALMETDHTTIQSCDGIAPLHLLYGPYGVLSAQKLGAKGLIWLSTKNSGQTDDGVSASFSEVVAVPPGVDLKEHTIKGTKVEIPLLTVDTVQNFNGETLHLDSEEHQWILRPPIQLDDNPYTPVFAPLGVYQIAWFTIGATSFCLGIIIGRYIYDVYRFYYKSGEKTLIAAMQMRLLILLPEFLNSFVRVLAAIDPYGMFPNHFDFFAGRMIFNLSNALSTYTDIATIIYCNDVYNIYMASRNMQQGIQPFIVKYKFGFWLIFVLATLMVILDQIVLYLGLIGQLGTDMVQTPILYVIVVSFVVVVILFRIAFKMQVAIKLVLEQLNKNLAAEIRIVKEPASITTSTTIPVQKKSSNKVSATIPPSNIQSTTGKFIVSKSPVPRVLPHNNHQITLTKRLIDKTKALLRMRNYMLCAGFGRVLSIIAFILVGSHWCLLSTFNFGFSLILMGIASLITSIAQTLAARQLPRHSKSSKKVEAIIPENMKT